MATESPVIGVVGLAVMGQNLALNCASKGFRTAVYNRSPEKVDVTVERAKAEGDLPLVGFKDMGEFCASLEKPRRIIILVKAGAPVDSTIAGLVPHLEPSDVIIDGGNEWFQNSIRRAEELSSKGIMFVGMGVSGGEEGARNGPSLMPGGPREAYNLLEPIITKIAAQVDDGPCVTYLGEIGAGNYVKTIHNGIEYGDMQLIGEAYDLLKNVGGFSNEELAKIFAEWNAGELDSFLIEITSIIFTKKDEDGESYLVDKVLDKTGMKGTGRWTIQEAAERSVAASTMSAALDMRYVSGMKDDRVALSKILTGPTEMPPVDRAQLVDDVRQALYAAKICSYAQGMNIIKEAAKQLKWNINLGECARIWKGGCIIRAKFLDRITQAYVRNPDLPSLLFDDEFAREVNTRQPSWRRVVSLGVATGTPTPAFSASLNYFDAYRKPHMHSASLVQSQRDFFGAHTFERHDRAGTFHAEWSK